MIQFHPMTRSTRPVRESFHLYPVPAKDHCKFVFPPDLRGPLEFSLFDLNGRLLQSRQFVSIGDEMHVDLTAVGSGMYFYLIRTPNAVFNGKLEVIK
jgi:hypothetical protein